MSISTFSYVPEEKFYFCCEECKNIFLKDPNRYIKEIEDKFVCPVCLGEKHKSEGISFEYEGKEIFFCRCPHCLDTFKNNPEFFIKSLEGKYDNKILKFGAD